MTVAISVTLDGNGNPVVESNPLPVVGTVTPTDCLSFVGSATATGVITYSSPGPSNGIIDTTGYAAVSIQIVNSGTGCNVYFQGSNDGVNWSNAVGYEIGTVGGLTVNAGSVGCVVIGKQFRYLRNNLVSYGSGTFEIAVAMLLANPPVMSVAQGQATNAWPVSGTVGVSSGTISINGGTVAVGNFPGTQTVSGTVAVVQTDTVAVDIVATAGNVPISGSVAISNIPSVVVNSGTVSIGNSPTVSVAGTPVVSGTVGISNFPTSQAVTGTLGISGGTVVVSSGSVSINNIPSVVINSGTVAVSGTSAVAGTVGVSGGTLAIQDCLTFTGTASAGGVVTYSSPGPSNGVIDTTGYAAVSVQITNSGLSSINTFQGSNDGTNWSQAYGFQFQSSPSSAVASGITANVFYIVPKQFRYFRNNITTYGGGTIAMSVAMMATSAPLAGLNQVTNTNYPWGVFLVGSTSGQIAPTRIQSAASTNSTLVKGSSAALYGIDIGNNGTTDAWLKLYNINTAPSVGVSTPTWTMYVPKGTARSVVFDVSVAFSAGLSYAITGGAADSDTTAVAAGQVTGIMNYK